MPLLTLSIGSNVDPQDNIQAAVRLLRQQFPDLNCSTVYESEAVGFDGDNFLNLVASCRTEKPLQDISTLLKEIEQRLGRDRSQPKFSARPMDIDILTLDDIVGEQNGVSLPRDEILQYAFVLKPLAELFPTQIHPTAKKPYAELWDQFDSDKQPIWPVEFDWQD